MPIPPFAVPDTTSEDGIRKLAERFKPIKIKNGKAFLIREGADLFNQAFMWDAKLDPYTGDLYTLDKLWTVHSYGYQGMFKPSLAEVLQQIPKIYTKLEKVYFEVEAPEDAQDLNLWVEHVHAGVHVAKTTLYLPTPTLHVMGEYYREHPEMLRMEKRFTPEMSAVRWLEAMAPKDRVTAMRFFCRKCGDRLGTEEKPLDLDMTPPADNFCNNCKVTGSRPFKPGDYSKNSG